MHFSTILLILIVTVVVIIEKTLSPRLDKTKEGDLLLWYNIKHNGVKYRKFIKLWGTM